MSNLTVVAIRTASRQSMNAAKRRQVNRDADLARQARKTGKQEMTNLATFGQLFSTANMSETQIDRVTYWLDWLSQYAESGSNLLESDKIDDRTGEFRLYDPVSRALRLARAFENAKNRNNLFDVVNTCFLVFLESSNWGTDENGNLLRVTETHQDAVYDRSPAICDDGKTRNLCTFGRNVKSFLLCENVDHLFRSTLNWSVKHVMDQNSGRVETTATAEKGYLQARGLSELYAEMDKTGKLNSEDKDTRSKLATGWNASEIAKMQGRSRKRVEGSIGRLREAARIATRK